MNLVLADPRVTCAAFALKPVLTAEPMVTAFTVVDLENFLVDEGGANLAGEGDEQLETEG